MRFSPRQIPVHFGGAIAGALKPLAADRYRSTDEQEHRSADGVAGGDPTAGDFDLNASDRAEDRGE